MADTINTGTMLIEEDALMPESLRFEGEPWTRFYMAGEIIRESQKASGKQSHYASEDNTAHSDEMIDHYNHPRNVGSQPKDDRMVASAWSAIEGNACHQEHEYRPRIQPSPGAILFDGLRRSLG